MKRELQSLNITRNRRSNGTCATRSRINTSNSLFKTIHFQKLELGSIQVRKILMAHHMTFVFYNFLRISNLILLLDSLFQQKPSILLAPTFSCMVTEAIDMTLRTFSLLSLLVYLLKKPRKLQLDSKIATLRLSLSESEATSRWEPSTN